MQRVILGLLDGSVRRQVFRGSCGALDTNELWEELDDRGFLQGQRRQIALATVRRACESLHRRGLVEGTYRKHMTFPWAYVIEWRAKGKG